MPSPARKPTLARLIACLVLAAAMIPSAWIAWHYRSMPQMGAYHDDAIYLESAKSLAETGSYRVASLPDQPYQTKYPPLMPLLLSIVWRIDPRFPENLPMLLAVCWSLQILFVAMMYRVLRQWGGSRAVAATLAILAALSPHVILVGIMTMSELLFTVFVMIAIVLLERGMDRAGSQPGLAIFALAGLACSLAFLTRTQGIALVASAAGILFWKKMWRPAAAFLAVSGVAVAGWVLWSHAHAYHGSDPVTLYYVDYVRFFFADVELRDVPLFLQSNVDAIFSAMAGLIFALPAHVLLARMLAWVVAIASISGLVRLTKESGRLHYPVYALLSALMLLPWPWTPNERFLIPILPAIAIGLFRELKHLYEMCRVNLRGAIPQRIAAVGMIAAGCAVCIASAAGNIYGTTVELPSILGDFQSIWSARQAGYAWIRTNVPADAKVLTYEDPLLYLATGHRALSMPVLHWLNYGGNPERSRAYFDTAAAFMTERHLDYALVTSGDFRGDLAAQGQQAMISALESSGNFERVFRFPGASVYRLKSPQPVIVSGSWWNSVRDRMPAIAADESTAAAAH